MKIKNETEIQLLKILFKTARKKPTKKITSARSYPHGLERKYFRQLQGFYKPLVDYVKKYVEENSEQLLRGDSAEVRLDAIPGKSFRSSAVTADLVPYTSNGFNAAAGRAQLGAKGPDVDVQGSVFPAELLTPDPIHDGIPGHGHAPVLQQEAEQFELLVGQGHILTGHPNDVLLGADKELTQLVTALLLLILGAAENGANSGHQLHHAKGLDEVIIRAAIQTHDIEAEDFGITEWRYKNGCIARFSVTTSFMASS